MKKPGIALLGLLISAVAVQADVKFTQLTDTQYVVHHRKLTVFGAEAKATRTALMEAASVCLAAGYSHMEIRDLNVGEREFGGPYDGGRGASADVRIKLYEQPDVETIEENDLIDCEPLADDEKVQVAREKLAAERDQEAGSRR